MKRKTAYNKNYMSIGVSGRTTKVVARSRQLHKVPSVGRHYKKPETQ